MRLPCEYIYQQEFVEGIPDGLIRGNFSMHRLLKANRCSLIAIGCFSQLSSHYHTSVNQPSNASKSTIDSLSDNQKSLRYKYVVVGYGTAAKTVVSGLIQGQSSTGMYDLVVS